MSNTATEIIEDAPRGLGFSIYGQYDDTDVDIDQIPLYSYVIIKDNSYGSRLYQKNSISTGELKLIDKGFFGRNIPKYADASNIYIKTGESSEVKLSDYIQSLKDIFNPTQG